MSHLFQTSVYISLTETLAMFALKFALPYCTQPIFPTIFTHKKCCQKWWCIPTTLTLRRLRPGEYEFKAIKQNASEQDLKDDSVGKGACHQHANPSLISGPRGRRREMILTLSSQLHTRAEAHSPHQKKYIIKSKTKKVGKAQLLAEKHTGSIGENLNPVKQ